MPHSIIEPTKLLHNAILSFVTNYGVEDHTLIILRAKHYSNINEGTNIYITPSVRARAQEWPEAASR